MAKRKKAKLPTRKQVEAQVLSRVIVPPMAVCIKTKHPDGSPATDGARYGRLVTELHGKDKWQLAERLRMMADFVAGSSGDDSGGVIVLLRQ